MTSEGKATVVYHVETHSNPRQIERLVTTINRWVPDAVIVVNHDRRWESPRQEVLRRAGAELVLVEGGYGDMSHVKRLLQTVKWLRDDNVAFDWLSNLTGQDYPIRPLNAVHRELAASDADAFIQTFEVLNPETTHWGVARGRTRYTFQHHRFRRLTPKQQRILRPLQAVNVVQPWFRFTTSTGLAFGVRKPAPWNSELVLRGGSFFATFGRRAVDAIYEFSQARPDVGDYLAHTIAPDEVYCQTVLGSTFGRDLLVVDDCRRYFDFSESTFNHPLTFGTQDLPAVFASGADFARKFDEQANPGVLDAVDAHLEQVAAGAVG
jgi:hypothetical protein